MLSVAKLTVGREDYYLNALSAGADEYYLDPAETPGRWHGTLAARLDLDGTVDPDAFRAVLDGRHPDGQPLVTNAGAKKRVSGFDLTFSAPKSVSLLWALSDPDTSARVAAAHDTAVNEAVGALETEAAYARRGHGGATQVPAVGLVAAGFGHRTSRAGDPQLHTHLVAANLALAEDGRWSALDGRVVYGWVKTIGYLYQAALRARLTETLGVTWGPVRNGTADIVGISPAQRERFSTRRAEITAHLDRYGHTTPAAAQIAALQTRPAKDHTLDLAALRAHWATQATDAGLQVTATLRPPRIPETLDLAGELLAPDGLTARATSFDRRNVLQALAAGHPDGAHPARLQAAATALLHHPEVVALATTTPAGGRRYTTGELLAVEARAVDQAVDRRHEQVAVTPAAVLDRVLAERDTLSSEQAAMVTRLATSGAGVEVVIGRAGTGKTFALDAARAAWETSGRRVIGTALAARAAAGLQAGAGIPSTTLDRLLADLDRPGPLSGLPPHTVIVLDEAGMVGTRKLDRLLTHAQRAGAKVVLVGDPRQLPEIDAGGTLAALARRLDAVQLTTNRRQEQPWERHALDQLRHGNVTTGITAYHRAGRITLAHSAETARQALVDDWWHARQAPTTTRATPGETAAMYALTRSDVEDLNRRARTHARAAGLLHGPDHMIAGRDFALGDVVLALRNDRRLKVRNGTLGTLTGLTADQATITTPDGLVVLPASYLHAGHLAHGYATTIHKAQGQTVDRAFLLGTDQLFREAGYVGLSRARTATRLYLVDPDPGRDQPGGPVDQLAANLTTSRAHTLALDQLPQPDQAGHAGPPDPAILRRAVLADPPEWAVETLGPPPLLGPDRGRWADTAARVASYRAAYPVPPSQPARQPGERQPVPDRITEALQVAIGPEPAEPTQHREWTLARLALTQTRHHGLDRDLDQGLSR